MGNIHITTQSGSHAEYDESQIGALWHEGAFAQDAQYWKPGMPDWRPLSEYVFAAAPSAAGISPSPRIEADSPYAPPASMLTVSPSLPAPASGSGSGFSYVRDPRGVTRFVVVMMWISLMFEIISILSDISQFTLLNRAYTEAEATANDSRQSLIGGAYLVVYIVTAIAFLMWVHRANVNCRGFGATNMQVTPGWAVGYYFIPILNLFKPYQSMKKIVQVSRDPSHWTSQTVSPLIGWWWALWLFANVFGQIIRFSADATTIDQFQTLTILTIVHKAEGIPLCLVALAMIKSIFRMQENLVNGQS